METNNSDFLPLLAISREKAERNLEEARNYISIDLANIRGVIALYHPLELAKMSVWEERRVSRLEKHDIQSMSARLMPFIIQSVLVSKGYEGRGINRDVKKKDWQRLISLSQDLTRKLVRYVDNLAALNYISGVISREDVMDYRESLFNQYFPSEKDYDRIRLERLFAETSLMWDDEKMREAFGVPSDIMIEEMFKLATDGLTMIDDLSAESTEFKTKVELRVAQEMAADPGISEVDARGRVYQDNEIRREKISLEGRRDDYDLFRPDFVTTLPSQVYEKMSAEPGTFDVEEYLFEKGVWPVTVCPFVKLYDMYFSFVAKYIFAIAERLSARYLHLTNRVEASTNTALESLFNATDIEGVYTFDGNKIDVVILPVLEDVNPVTDAEYWQTQMKRKSEDYLAKPEYGHKMLIVDADDWSDDVETIDKDKFWTTSSHIIKVWAMTEDKREFYETIFGSFDHVDQDPNIGAIFDEDCIIKGDDSEYPQDPEDDKLEFDSLDVDEYEEETEENKDETVVDPMSVSFRPEFDTDEKNRFRSVFEENQDIIESELEEKVPVSEYSGVLDDDIYAIKDEDDDIDLDEDLALDVDDDDYATDAKGDDADEDEEEDDDQLDFMDLLDDFDEKDGDEEDDLEIVPEENVTVPVWRDDEENETEEDEVENAEEFPADMAEEEGLSELNEMTRENDNEVSDGPSWPEEKTEEEGLRDVDVLEPVEDTDLEREEEEAPFIVEEEYLEDEDEDDFDPDELFSPETVDMLEEYLGRESTHEDREWLYDFVEPKLVSFDISNEEFNAICMASLIALIYTADDAEDSEEEDEEATEAEEGELLSADEKEAEEEEKKEIERDEDLTGLEGDDARDEDAEEEFDDEEEEDDGESEWEMTDEALECLYDEDVISSLWKYIGHEPQIEDKRWLYDLMDPSLRSEDLSGEDYNQIARTVLDILSEEEENDENADEEVHVYDEGEVELFDEDDEEEDDEEDRWEMTDEALLDLYDEEVLSLLAEYKGHDVEAEDLRWLYDQMDPALRSEDLSGEDYNQIAKASLMILLGREDGEDHETDEITGYEEEPLTDEEIEALYDDETVALYSEKLGHPATTEDKRILNDALDIISSELSEGLDKDKLEKAIDEAVAEEEKKNEEVEKLFDDDTLALYEEKLGRPVTTEDKRVLDDALDILSEAISEGVDKEKLEKAIDEAIESAEKDEEYPTHEETPSAGTERRDDYKPFELDDDHTHENAEEADNDDPQYFFLDDVSLDDAEEEKTEDDDETTFAFIDEDEDEEDEESVSREDDDAPAFFLNGEKADDALSTPDEDDEPIDEEDDEELIPSDFYTEVEDEEKTEDIIVKDTEEDDEELETDALATVEDEEEARIDEEFAPEIEGKESDQIVLEYSDEEEEEEEDAEEPETEEEGNVEEAQAEAEEEAEETTVEEEAPSEPEVMTEEKKAAQSGKLTSSLAMSLFLDVPGINPAYEGKSGEKAPQAPIIDASSHKELEEEPAEEVKEEEPVEEPEPVVEEEPETPAEPETVVEEKADEPVAEAEPVAPVASAPAPKNPEGIVLEYEEDAEEEEEEEEKSQEEPVPVEEEEEEKVFVVNPEVVAAAETPVEESGESEQILSTEKNDMTDESEDADDDKTITLDLENPKYSEIIREIAQMLGKNAGAFADFLENEERVVLDHFNQVIRQSWERQLADGKDKMFSVFNYDLSILLSKSMVHDDLRLEELLNNAGAVMYSKRKESWNALMVYINKDYTVECAELKVIRKEDFSPANWKIVSNIGQELINRRNK